MSSADGGSGGTTSTSGCAGAGSGGRIAIHAYEYLQRNPKDYDRTTFPITAVSGDSCVSGHSMGEGGAGTIYLRQGAYDELYLFNNHNGHEQDASTPWPADLPADLNKVNVFNHARILVPAGKTLRAYEVDLRADSEIVGSDFTIDALRVRVSTDSSITADSRLTMQDASFVSATRNPYAAYSRAFDQLLSHCTFVMVVAQVD